MAFKILLYGEIDHFVTILRLSNTWIFTIKHFKISWLSKELRFATVHLKSTKELLESTIVISKYVLVFRDQNLLSHLADLTDLEVEFHCLLL